jgi:hypothetical protein
MVLSAVITTWESSETMKEAAEVRARTQFLADVEFDSVIKASSDGKDPRDCDVAPPIYETETNSQGERIREKNHPASESFA